MSDPKRLLDTECGRTRELLHVGLSELAPAKVRTHVLSSVDSVVASLELDASGTELEHRGGSDASDSSDNSGGSDTLGARAVTSKTPLPAGTTDAVLAKSALFAKGSTVLQLSATLAALGLGGLAYHELGQRNEAPVVAPAAPRLTPAAPLEAPPSASIATVPDALPTPPTVHALPPGEGPASREVPVSRQVPESRERSAPPTAAQRGRPRGSGRAGDGDGMSRREGAPADDLAGELSLLQRTRRLLSTGDVGRARELLDEYERHYPRGALRPEADALRERSQRNPSR
jgi:hypothetical protein